jgi:hypothetical protein
MQVEDETNKTLDKRKPDQSCVKTRNPEEIYIRGKHIFY